MPKSSMHVCFTIKSCRFGIKPQVMSSEPARGHPNWLMKVASPLSGTRRRILGIAVLEIFNEQGASAT